MKQLIIMLIATISLCVVSCVGEYETVEKYSGEVVYPATFDTIYAHVGFERVELDLWQAGRVSEAKMKLGKAVRTIVEYDGKQYPIDSICSWVNVTGLTESKLYRIKVYTEDQYGNYSVPKEISVIPYTAFDASLIAFAPPKLLVSKTELSASWAAGALNSVVAEFHGMVYSWTDASGDLHEEGFKPDETMITLKNLPESAPVKINFAYRVVPIQSNGSKILDTLVIERPMEVQLLNDNSPITLAESNIFRANGIIDPTLSSLAKVKSLKYAQTVTTFADLYYCTGLETLDMTGVGVEGCMPTLDYNRNGYLTTCGGGLWQPYMKRVEKPADIKLQSVDLLLSMLENGQLKKVKYIPGSLWLDDQLAPYVTTGQVELVADDDPIFPNEVYLGPECFIKGIVVDNNWDLMNYYSGDFLPRGGYSDIGKFDASHEVVNGEVIDLKLEQLTESQRDGKNIYKCVPKAGSASFAMALPKTFMYDSKRYRYLKFKYFCGSTPEVMEGDNSNFLKPWLRPMNYMWNFGGNSVYGQENWDHTFDPISKPEIQTTWHEYVLDMNDNHYWNDNNTNNRRNRVIVFNIGQEFNAGWRPAADAKTVAIYVADIRLCKNQ